MSRNLKKGVCYVILRGEDADILNRIAEDNCRTAKGQVAFWLRQIVLNQEKTNKQAG